MKILMICLGNICRSPLAEGIMQHLVHQAGLNWTVDSAGTGSWHVGECPDHRSTAVAKGYGVDISKQLCRQFSVNDFDEFDLLLTMDRNNLRDVLRLARNDGDKAKVRLLLKNREVPDPYYDSNQFDPVYKLIENGCKAIINEYH
ncbi:low molecular weight protein-tyrosine-phosphatase [Mucilaginibacter terrae]|uniref:protein-tyrosine-phosphatase n=1 Tax=Mucilaginibacter terrae TaxID=1955052 RepID=A0ABU3GV30_9SPHI|nr:low molecular weight protein-tyrosine-phosphatase [Mucilaginibacter terrae]MDT3403628.1 protein-tyrosine phosphatase [Mucilaginibacter terrae]